MTHMETDYLVIGSGAVGLAFADTLLDELPDVHITIVDRHGKPGGHWNDAYPFVALHQPSAFYGVNSLPLGANRKDAVGVNKGFYELASGPEVSGYFHQVMHQKLLPSGRVSYRPMCNYLGDHRFESILSGAQTQVTVRRKLVDATYYGTSVPATHQPKYAVADGVRLVTPQRTGPAVAGKGAAAGALRDRGRRQDRDGRGRVAAAVRRPPRRHPVGGAARLVGDQPGARPAGHRVLPRDDGRPGQRDGGHCARHVGP